MVKALGVVEVIDYTQEDFTTSGRAYDIIFDTVGKLSFAMCKGSLTDEGVYLTTSSALAPILQALRLTNRRGKRARFMAAGMQRASEKVKDLVFLTGLI